MNKLRKYINTKDLSNLKESRKRVLGTKYKKKTNRKQIGKCFA